jgi:GNAT superfamily N-acetyltransferase
VATLSDAPRLVRIHHEARAAAMPWLPALHTAAETQAWIANVVLVQQEVWIAAAGDAVAGFMALTDGWIEQLYIDPASWRNGAGSALLQRAKSSSRRVFGSGPFSATRWRGRFIASTALRSFARPMAMTTKRKSLTCCSAGN